MGRLTSIDTAWGRRSESKRKRGKISNSFYENLSVEHPPWTLPGVEGTKAKEKGKKNSVSFYGNFTVVWDDDPPWTLLAVEGKKADRKIEKVPLILRKFKCGTTTLHRQGEGTKVGNFLTRVSNKIKLR